MSTRYFPVRLFLGVFLSLPGLAQVTVSTHHYDNSRTGLNAEEKILTASNLNTGEFGMIGSFAVDGQLYAQPLYIPNVNIVGKGTYNVLYVATMNNSVYAFDADATTTTILWQRNYNNAAVGVTPVPFADVELSDELDINGPIGIEGTPVIDAPNSTMYFVVRTKESGSYQQRLHAIDIRSGSEMTGSPVVITASIKNNAGTILTFNAKTQNQRVPITLANNMVYITWASHNDITPYYGWVLAYNIAQAKAPLTQAYAYNDEMNASKGGIWMAGSAPVVDPSGNLYFIVGNGDWNGTTDFGQSIIKLSSTLKVVDYFTPDNWQAESIDDVDLGCGGLLLFPGTDYLLGGSKQGILYLVDTTSMGHMVAGNTQILQLFQAANGHIHSGPTYYNSPKLGPIVFIWSENDYLKAYGLAGSVLQTTPLSKSEFQDPAGMPGGFMVISSNGNVEGTAVLWANVPYSGNAAHATVPGVLRAFDPNNLATELWDSHMNAARDDFGNFAKDVPPVVANGRVFMATFSNAVAVYGLLSSPVSSLHINVGGSTVGSWTADEDYIGGNSATKVAPVDVSAVSNPAPVSVYQSERWGPATYSIPGLTPGATYHVRLHFNDWYWYKAGQRRFNVSINGTKVLSNFDIIATAGKPNKAVAEQFQTKATSSGKIVVALTNGAADNATVEGIEISQTSFLSTAAAINAGGSTIGSFVSDTDYSGGSVSTSSKTIDTSAVSNPAPQAVYQSERWGPSTYTIPGLTPGRQYTVRLHFAESYWNAKGQRIFNVAINGAAVLSSFDIVATAGAADKAAVEQFTATADASGQITISFTNGSVDNATINGIEVQ